jgi:hypothetical protein
MEKLTQKDVVICRALRNIVLNGKYEIMGEALEQSGALFNWFSTLDQRIEETIKPPPPMLSPYAVVEAPKPDKKKK